MLGGVHDVTHGLDRLAGKRDQLNEQHHIAHAEVTARRIHKDDRVDAEEDEGHEDTADEIHPVPVPGLIAGILHRAGVAAAEDCQFAQLLDK